MRDCSLHIEIEMQQEVDLIQQHKARGAKGGGYLTGFSSPLTEKMTTFAGSPTVELQ